eukprot:g118.t1
MAVDDRTGDLTRSIEMLDTAQRRFESLLNRSMSRISTKLDNALGSTRTRRSDRSARAAAAAVLSPAPSGFAGDIDDDGDSGLILTGRSAQQSSPPSVSSARTGGLGGRIAKAGAAALSTALGSPVQSGRSHGTARAPSTALSTHRGHGSQCSDRSARSARNSTASPATQAVSPERAGAGQALRRASAIGVLRRLHELLQRKGLRVHELYVDRRLNQQDFTRPDFDAKKRRPSQFCDMTDYVRGAWCAPDHLDHSRQTWSVFFSSMRPLGLALTAEELRDTAWYMQNLVAARNARTGDVYNPAHLRTDALEEALRKVKHADTHTGIGTHGHRDSSALTKALQKALKLRDSGGDAASARGDDTTGYAQQQRLAHMHNLTGQRFRLRSKAKSPPKRIMQLATGGVRR